MKAYGFRTPDYDSLSIDDKEILGVGRNDCNAGTSFILLTDRTAIDVKGDFLTVAKKVYSK